MKNGSKITEEISVADAHPNGKNPFKREDYIKKFKTLTNGIIESSESERFLNDVQNLKSLGKSELNKLNIQLKEDLLQNKVSNKSIF
jgi:2-methylcitrate dehydratase